MALIIIGKGFTTEPHPHPGSFFYTLTETLGNETAQ